MQNCRKEVNFLWIRSCIFVIIAIYSWAQVDDTEKKSLFCHANYLYDCIRTYFALIFRVFNE